MNRWLVFGCLGYCLFSGEILHGEHGGTAVLEKARKDRGAQLNGKVLNQTVPVFWSKEGTHAFYPHDTAPGKREWKALNLQSGETRVLEKKPDECDESLKEPPEPEQKNPPLISRTGFKSPDGNQVVKLENGKVFLNGEEILGIAGERLEWQDKIYWAPDSSRFVIGKTTKHPVRQVHFVQSSPEDSVQPEHFSINYPKPGDELNIARPVIVFTDGREPLEVDASLIENPYQLRNWGWRPDSERFLFEFIERGFGSHCIIEMQSEARTQRALVRESDEKFVFVYGNSFRRDLKGGSEILWLSERDGWNHLYLLDGNSGKVIRQLTKGKWVVREVLAVDETARFAILEISGFHPKQDPYHIHYARLDLDSGTLTPLTEGDGTHELRWSPDGTHYVAKWSRVDQAPTHEIRRFSDGEKLSTISAADDLGLLSKEDWVKPQRFVSKDRNGEYDIHGMILRPANIQVGKRYPVIEAIYAGPHGSFTPKAWRAHHGGMSEMADAGFIVVKLDALGTNHRGRKFQQVAYRNLIDSGFPDRIKWIQAAAEQIPEMDIGRVGIFGGSAGGQSALAALLTHPEFYRAGAADCGCHDNRMDKIWWNEQWMDWPVGPHYEANSNLTHIDKLEGHLLLTVGELDKNVDPSSTYQVVDALVRADKDFEFFVIPGAGHGVGEQPYLRRKRIKFFQRHLGGPE
jgi:dienelactone hydrolase